MSQYNVLIQEPSSSKYKKLDSAERSAFISKHCEAIRQRVLDWIAENNLQGEITNIGNVNEDTVLPFFQIECTKEAYVHKLREINGVVGILSNQVPYLID